MVLQEVKSNYYSHCATTDRKVSQGEQSQRVKDCNHVYCLLNAPEVRLYDCFA